MVEDKVLLGLTVRQCLYLLVGCSASYGLWGHLSAAPAIVHIGVPVISALLAAACALIRPAGRPIEEWLAAALVFWGSPRQACWQVDEPRAQDWRWPSGLWQQLSPDAAWAQDGEATEA